MTAKSMLPYVESTSAIRAMFEEGTRMAKEFGAENVYDLSLGNPSVPAPPQVNQAIREVVDEVDPLTLHGYNKSNCGYEDVRADVAEHLNRLHGTSFTSENIIMTVGAACGINVAIKTLVDPGEEVLTFAPYFGEYGNYAMNHGAVFKAVPANPPSFQPNLEELEKMIGEKTRAIIINSPNNPTGVVYDRQTLEKLAALLTRKSEELGHHIFIISDEPYRDLAYDGVDVPWITGMYPDTIVCYSWSKALSLPGERIGYMIMPSEIDDFENAMMVATLLIRVLGFVNAPSIMQKAVARCLDCRTDISIYDKNRKALYEGLTDIGFECAHPDGAFYMFVKSPIDDDVAFCAMAKKYHILIVPGKSFGCPGYVRMAYCVDYDTIVNSMPHFRELYKEATS